MSFMTLAGSQISIASGSVSEDRKLIGSISRAFSGAARYDFRSFKRTWKLETTPLTTAEYADLVALVEVSTGTIAMNGDIVGSSSTNVYVIIKSSKIVSHGSLGGWKTDLRQASLEIWES